MWMAVRPLSFADFWLMENKVDFTTFRPKIKDFCYVSSQFCGFLGSAAAAAAKSLQSCPTLWDPRDGSPPGSPFRGILQARTLEWVAISFSNAWKWKVKVKSLSHVQLFTTPWTAAHQAPLSMGFSRQEYWSGVPLPSPKMRQSNILHPLLGVHQTPRASMSEMFAFTKPQTPCSYTHPPFFLWHKMPSSGKCTSSWAFGEWAGAFVPRLRAAPFPAGMEGASS